MSLRRAVLRPDDLAGKLRGADEHDRLGREPADLSDGPMVAMPGVSTACLVRDVDLGDDSRCGDPHDELRRHGIAPAELFRTINAHVPPADPRRP